MLHLKKKFTKLKMRRYRIYINVLVSHIVTQWFASHLFQNSFILYFQDFEISVKVRRRNEVEWLYEFGKASKSKSESDTSAQENVDEPKAKVPRYENAVSVDSKKKEVTNDTTMNGNGKTNGCGSYLPARKSSYENGELDFISVDWMSQWLDGGNPVPPIENAMLCCPHKKLAPPQPNSTPCLYRIIPTPLVFSHLGLKYPTKFTI